MNKTHLLILLAGAAAGYFLADKLIQYPPFSTVANLVTKPQNS